ncbi:MAG: hypothetical protein H6Q69_175 [Firmicutes bacterium]|nr:hypothetical protein [Bacillota bacterium]
MGVLWQRLIRAIKETAGQFIALAIIVALGVSNYYGMNMAISSLVQSQYDFYRETKSADYYFHVQRAPDTILKEIEKLPGIEQVTGRIQEEAKITVAGKPHGTGRIVSFEPDYGNQINDFKKDAGIVSEAAALMSESEIKAYLDSQYYTANDVLPGAKMDITAKRRQVTVEVAGAVSSPDYLYKIRNARDISDRANFAILYIPRRSVEKMLDMEREVNQILIRFSPGANEVLLRDLICDKLAPYGLITHYPQREQTSAKYIESQIEGLKVSAAILPVGFFISAIGIIYILLHRYITMQHFQIGVMKAIGYDNATVITYYTLYALAVTLTGAIMGICLGNTLGYVAFSKFAKLLTLPEQYIPTEGGLLGINIAICVLTGLVAGILSSRSITKIEPALALHSGPADSGGKRPVTISAAWGQIIPNSWKMTLRSVARNKGRFIVTTAGLALSVGLLIVAIYFSNSKDYLAFRHFNFENRYDYYISLNNTVKAGDLQYLSNWQGIRETEPMLEVAVSLSPVQTNGKGREAKESLIAGIRPDCRMIGVFDEDENPVIIPEEGILLNNKVAQKLGLGIGDKIAIKTNPIRGSSYIDNLTIVGLVKQNMGACSYVSLARAQKLVNEKDAVNTLLLQTDNPVIKKLEDRLLEIPEVTFLQSKVRQEEMFNYLVSAMSYFTLIMTIIAGVMGAAIVYNTSIINFNERQRELASLRIIGWSMGDIAFFLFKEIILAMVLAIIIGFPAGKYCGAIYLKAASTEHFTWPIIIYPSTYFIAACLTVAFAALGHLMAVTRVKNLNMVEVLKSRD